tara:strand:+ start:402 stop:728 length:327 start_codon:yes stop_codon:yes gene_type:complete
MANEENGWNEWSRHVLKELERLNDNYEILRVQNEEIKTEVSKATSMKGEFDDVKAWKARIDDVCSPAQLRDVIRDLESLKIFKSKAVAIFATVQFAMVAIAWALKIFS